MKIDLGPTVYLPGDKVPLPSEAWAEEGPALVLGPGLRKGRGPRELFACAPGVLRRKDPRTFWIDTKTRRYVPVEGDRVVGVVTARMGEGWKVDIGAADLAQLPMLSFEGATKRNRALFREGALLYCRVVSAVKDLEPEVSCVAEDEKARGLGELPTEGGGDSCLFHIPLSLARKLLSPHCSLLKVLGRGLKFEVTIGLNGRLWVKAASVREVIAVANCLQEAEASTEADVHELAEKHLKWIQGF